MAFAWEIWNFHSASGGFPDVPRPLNLNLGFALHPSGLHFSLRQLRGSDHFQHGVREGGEEFGSGCFALSPRSYRGLDGRGKLKLWAAALAVFNRKGRLTRKQLCDLVDGFRAQQVLCSFFNRWRGVIAGAYSTEDFFRLFVALVDDVPSMRDCIQAPSRLSVPKTDRAAAQVLCRRLLFWQFQEIYFLRQELWVNLHIAPQARIDAWFLEKKFSVQTCWFSRDVDLRVQNALIRRKIAYGTHFL